VHISGGVHHDVDVTGGAGCDRGANSVQLTIDSRIENGTGDEVKDLLNATLSVP
jgi:hypothetical protein